MSVGWKLTLLAGVAAIRKTPGAALYAQSAPTSDPVASL